MSKSMGLAVVFGLAAVVAGASGVHAQACVETIGEASGPSRDAALREAYAAMLSGVNPALARQWQASGQRIGEAPGYSIRKLTTNCSPRGAGTFCRVSAILCR